MVDILCPHCEEEIALDDDASGEFVCPYCGGEFEWNVEPEVVLEPNWFQEYNESKNTTSTIGKIISGGISRGISGSFFLGGIVMIIVGIAGLAISFGILASLTESTPSEAAGAGAVIVLGLVGIGFLLSITIGLSGLGIVFAGLSRMISK